MLRKRATLFGLLFLFVFTFTFVVGISQQAAAGDDPCCQDGLNRGQ